MTAALANVAFEGKADINAELTSLHAKATIELRADLNALRQTVNKVAGDDNSIIDLPSLRVGKPLN